MIRWLKTKYQKHKKEQERKRKKREKLLERCYNMKISVLQDFVENKNPFAKEKLSLSEDVYIKFELRIDLWDFIRFDPIGYNFYECSLSGKKVLKWETNFIPKGPLFFLEIRASAPEYWGKQISIFTLGQKFYTFESRSHIENYVNAFRSYRTSEYFWPVNPEVVFFEYTQYKMLQTLGATEEVTFQIFKKNRHELEKELKSILKKEK